MDGSPTSYSAPNSNKRAYFLLTITTLCWGCNAIFSRLAVGEVSPLTLVALRWAAVMIFLFVLARQDVKRDWPVLKTRLPFLMLIGAIGFTGFNALFYLAAHTTTAVNIGILQGAIPVFVLVSAFVLHRTPVGLFQAIGVTTTIIGVVIVASGGDLDRLLSLAFNHGDLLMLIACFLYASYTLALRNKPNVSAMGLFAVLAFSAFLTSLPLVAGEIALGQFRAPTMVGWILIASIAVLPSFLAQICFINGVAIIGPGRAGVFVNLVPIFASIFAVVFLGEPFKLYHAFALALVLGGIWLSERGK
ncbi:DMT family transporter [Sneathiella sp.]|uniref:DMT family transporter n=1 Tax=Sneathiella sp. TaxID=1964365 RepID=UPI0039E378F8